MRITCGGGGYKNNEERIMKHREICREEMKRNINGKTEKISPVLSSSDSPLCPILEREHHTVRIKPSGENVEKWTIFLSIVDPYLCLDPLDRCHLSPLPHSCQNRGRRRLFEPKDCITSVHLQELEVQWAMKERVPIPKPRVQQSVCLKNAEVIRRNEDAAIRRESKRKEGREGMRISFQKDSEKLNKEENTSLPSMGRTNVPRCRSSVIIDP